MRLQDLRERSEYPTCTNYIGLAEVRRIIGGSYGSLNYLAKVGILKTWEAPRRTWRDKPCLQYHPLEIQVLKEVLALGLSNKKLKQISSGLSDD